MNDDLKYRITTVIYNTYSFLIFVIVFFITYLLTLFGIKTINVGNPYFWILVLLISGIADIFKIRARLYFFPLWLISLIIAVIISLNRYTNIDLYISFGTILFLLVLGVLFMKMMSKKDWKSAKRSLIELKEKQSASIWNDLRKAFHVPEYLYPNSGFQYILLGKIYRPIYLKWISKDEVNKHFIEVCKILKSKIQETEYNRYVSLFENKLHKVAKGEKTSFEQHMFENIINLIEKYSK